MVGCGEAARHAGMRRVKRLERLKRPAAAAGRDHDQTRRPGHKLRRESFNLMTLHWLNEVL